METSCGDRPPVTTTRCCEASLGRLPEEGLNSFSITYLRASPKSDDWPPIWRSLLIADITACLLLCELRENSVLTLSEYCTTATRTWSGCTSSCWTTLRMKSRIWAIPAPPVVSEPSTRKMMSFFPRLMVPSKQAQQINVYFLLK